MQNRRLSTSRVRSNVADDPWTLITSRSGFMTEQLVFILFFLFCENFACDLRCARAPLCVPCDVDCRQPRRERCRNPLRGLERRLIVRSFVPISRVVNVFSLKAVTFDSVTTTEWETRGFSIYERILSKKE